MNWLDNKHVLIVGASDGIGRALAEKLAYNTRHLSLVASNRTGKLDSLVKDLRQKMFDSSNRRAQIDGFTLDVRDYILSQKAVLEMHHQDPIDCVIYAAGGTPKYDLSENFSFQEIQDIFDINLTALACWMKFLVPLLKENKATNNRKKAHVVLLSSRSGERALPNLAAYAAAKGGVERLSEALQKECAKDQIAFSLVNPGSINTAFTAKWENQQAAEFHNKQSMPMENVVDLLLATMNVDCVVNKISFESMEQWKTEPGALQ